MEFELKQRVRIIDLDKKGRVVAKYICETGVQYQVRYMDNCTPHTVYFYEDELEAAKEPA